MDKKLRITSSGITLLEILITIIVSVILLGAMFLSFTIGLERWEETNINSLITRNALFSMDKMIKEIRQAVSIYDAEEKKLTIDVDINPLDTNLSPERVSYYLNSSDESLLMRKIWGKDGSSDIVRVLTNDVKGLQFVYRDKEDNVTTDTDKIKLVEVNLTLGKERRKISLTSSTNLRNIHE